MDFSRKRLIIQLVSRYDSLLRGRSSCTLLTRKSYLKDSSLISITHFSLLHAIVCPNERLNHVVTYCPTERTRWTYAREIFTDALAFREEVILKTLTSIAEKIKIWIAYRAISNCSKGAFMGTVGGN
ncbi:hypothetical protein TNCT_364231 [Trichonephila clavata]|uniref:Uncharacterized protein n=1 Tax=Trichonephila clavata TaxID=2740835 RepID=A0A8X6ILT4_TRICU|nr:hypothetical protein TNCT_364231 [Trichonephila clavata]